MNKKKHIIRTILDLAIVLASILVLGIVLYFVQTQYSINRQKENSSLKLDVARQRITTYAQDAIDDRSRFDAFSQAKADTLAFYYANNGSENLALSATQWGLEELYIVDKSGHIKATNLTDVSTDFTSMDTFGPLFQNKTPITIDHISYYISSIDGNQSLIAGRDCTDELAAEQEMTDPAYSLHSIRVGTNGYVAAIRLADQTIAYHPDTTLIGQNINALFGSTKNLRDGYQGFISRGNETFYCQCSVLNDTWLLVSAVPKSEIDAFTFRKILMVLTVFTLILIVMVCYINFLRHDKSPSHIIAEQKDMLPLGKHFYLNRLLLQKTFIIITIGTILIFCSSYYMQQLNALSAQTVRFQNKLSDVQALTKENQDKLETLKEEYNQEFLRRAENIAVLLKNDPRLLENDKLAELTSRAQLRSIYVFDSTGKTVATNTAYTDFRLKNDPDAQSYIFWNIINGYENEIVQEAQISDSSQTYTQFIGVKRLDDAGMVQIEVSPKRLADRLQEAQMDHILSMTAVENNGFIFTIDKDTLEVTYYPGLDTETVLTAKELGLTDAALTNAYTGYQTIQSINCFTSCMEYNNSYLFVAVPSRNIGNGIVAVTLIVTLVSLLLLLIIVLPLVISVTPGNEKTDIPSKTKEGFLKEPVGMIRIPDGEQKTRLVQSIVSRWTNASGVTWPNQTPEQKLCRILYYLVVAIACVLFVFIYAHRGTYDESSILSYIIHQKWEKKPNIFSITYIGIIMIEVLVVTGILRRLIKYFSAAMGARIETIGRLLNSFIKYGAVLGSLFYCLTFLGVNSTALLASAGIMGLVIGLGAQSLISDILAGIFMVFEGEFRVGDIVTIGDWRGKVREIGIRSTKVEDASQNIKIFNNSTISQVINMTKKYSYASCDVGIEYSESLEHVESILGKELPAVKNKLPSILAGPYYKGVISLGDSSVVIRILAQCNEDDRIQLTRDLNREMKLIFDRNHIGIPFPQIVINQPTEHKEATKREANAAAAFVKEQKESTKNITIEH